MLELGCAAKVACRVFSRREGYSVDRGGPQIRELDDRALSERSGFLEIRAIGPVVAFAQLTVLAIQLDEIRLSGEIVSKRVLWL